MPSFILLVTKESWFTSVNFSKDVCDVRHLRHFSTKHTVLRFMSLMHGIVWWNCYLQSVTMTFYTETNSSYQYTQQLERSLNRFPLSQTPATMTIFHDDEKYIRKYFCSVYVVW